MGVDMNEAALIARLAAELGAALQAQRATLATAESCTGGGIGYAVTQVAGSSAWFERGFITYSNEAKQQMLDVPAELIARHGAVSESVARAMALGALASSRAHIAVSVTGIAGPGGGSRAKPVGTVCFGFARIAPDGTSKVATVTRRFDGDRAAVRTQSIIAALQGLLDLLQIKVEAEASDDCATHGTNVGTFAVPHRSRRYAPYVAARRTRNGGRR
jgi:nicotinamide-nucleotide amidase